jgi:hypothetical protein
MWREAAKPMVGIISQFAFIHQKIARNAIGSLRIWLSSTNDFVSKTGKT